MYNSTAPLLTGEESVVLTLAAVVMSVVAVSSNSVLLYGVVRTPALHTPTNVLTASLCGGHLLTALLVLPWAGPLLSLRLPPSVRRALGALHVLGPCVATLSLLAVALDRCLAVCCPLRYARLASKGTAAALTGAVWLLGVVVTLLPLGLWGPTAYSDCCTACEMSSSVSQTPRAEVVKEAVSVVVPAGLVLPLVLRTLQTVRGRRRVFVLVSMPVTATSLPPVSCHLARGLSLAPSLSLSTSLAPAKTVRTLVLLTLIHLGTCLPAGLAVLFCQSSALCDVSCRTMAAFTWLSFLSGVLSPLVIITLHRSFRDRLRALLWDWSRGQQGEVIVTRGLRAALGVSLLSPNRPEVILPVYRG